MSLRGKEVLVVGLEKSGMASIAFLQGQGAHVIATDVKADAADHLVQSSVPFFLQSEAPFESVDMIVPSPGVPLDIAPLDRARARGIPVIGEVELAGPFLKGRTIGITGTNGKTTTTVLIGHILRYAGVPVQVGGNIGTPVTAMVAGSREDQWNVLELSSFQLETLRAFHAHIALALNVTQNHLDRHHTFENYAAAKGNLFRTQKPGDLAVLNSADPVCRSFAELTPAARVWFNGDNLLGELLPPGDVPIRGRHNMENAMAAVSVARLVGIPDATIAAAIRTFKAVEHRLEFVRTVSGVDFYNDSKATSVDATMKALNSFEGRLWVILGGKDKGSDYTTLRDSLAAKARGVMLIGEAAPIIRNDLTGGVPLRDAETLHNAVTAAYENAEPGDTILLAPACASFDQFQSYEHRGRVFKEIVSQLQPK